MQTSMKPQRAIENTRGAARFAVLVRRLQIGLQPLFAVGKSNPANSNLEFLL
jgi:hypothetical protein